MIAAIISDVHGNADALAAVLAQARILGCERLLVLGDLVGYYHQPREVMKLLREWDFSLVQGNHDAMLARAADDAPFLVETKSKYGSGLAIALETLDSSDLELLIKAPSRRLESMGDFKVLLCHGSPRDRDEYVYPDAPGEVLDACSGEGDIVLMGHTHHPFVAVRNGVLLVNAGSVGQARDGGGVASWSTINTANGAVVPRRTAYDVTPVKRRAAEIDPGNTYLVRVLER
jgi:putative phosphoesterase